LSTIVILESDGVVGRRDVERVDVEAAAGNHAGHARQNPELVLNED
jgi:hypothetical protein